MDRTCSRKNNLPHPPKSVLCTGACIKNLSRPDERFSGLHRGLHKKPKTVWRTFHVYNWNHFTNKGNGDFLVNRGQDTFMSHPMLILKTLLTFNYKISFGICGTSQDKWSWNEFFVFCCGLVLVYILQVYFTGLGQSCVEEFLEIYG